MGGVGGEAEIERLRAAGLLDDLSRAAADGSAVMRQANRRLLIAEAALAIDPDGAYTNAYDAARLDTARRLVDLAAKILPQLGFFNDRPW